MTDLQRTRFYFPAWNLCCRANGWKMAGSRLVFDAGALTEEGRKAVTLANQRALMEHRPVTLDDLRHGVHIVALGRDKSSEHLTNAEVDRVVALFHYLRAPEDLTAVMKWTAYERGEDPGQLRRIEFVIRSVPEALQRHIALDMIGTRDWESASLAQKLILSRRIAQWKSGKRAGKAESGKRKAETGNLPAAVAAGNSYQLDPNKKFTPKPAVQPELMPAIASASGDPDWTVD